MVALPFSANCRVIDQYVPVDLIMLNVKDRKEEMIIEPFKHKIWLSSPTMHGDELKFMTEAYDTNWMSTVGKNINEAEKTKKASADSSDSAGCSMHWIFSPAALCRKERGGRNGGIGHFRQYLSGRF